MEKIQVMLVTNIGIIMCELNLESEFELIKVCLHRLSS